MTDTDWWYLDLAIVIAYAGAVTVALLSGLDGIARLVITIPLVLFVPGYAVVSVWYPDIAEPAVPFDGTKTGLTNPVPGHRGLTPVERLCGAVVCSLLIIPPVTLAATVSPWGIAPTPIALGLTGVTIVGAVLAIVTRWRTTPERRFDLAKIASPMIPPSAGTRTQPVTAFNVALVLSLVLLGGTIGYAIANPPAGDGYTEFYLDTEPITGETETMYEDTLAEGATTDFTVHIVNAEQRNVEYTVVSLMQTVEHTNESTDVRETDELDRTSVQVASGEHHEETIEITPTMVGEDVQVVFLLYIGDAPDDPTEERAAQALRLPVIVS